MNSRRTAVAALTLALLLAPRAWGAEGASEPAQYLPESTFLCVQVRPWKEWAKAWPETSLAKIADEPELKAFLAGPISKVRDLVRKLTEPAAGAAPAPAGASKSSVAEVVFSTLGELAPGPLVFALSRSAEQAQAKRPASAALVLGTKDASQIATAVQALLRLFNVQTVQQQKYNNADLLVLKTDTYSFTVTFHNNHLILTSDVELCQQVIDGMSGTLPKKLSDRDSFKACGLGGTEHLSAFLDVAALRGLVGAGPAGGGRFREVLAQSGLEDARAMSWSLRMDGAAFESRTALAGGEKRGGLLAALDAEPLDPAALKICPPGCPLALGVRVQPEALVGLLGALVSLTGGSEGSVRFEALLKKLAADGRDLKREANEIFTRDLVAASYVNQEKASALDPRRTVVAALGVKDAAKADAFLADLQKRMIAVQNPGAKAEDWLKEQEYEGVKIRYIQPPPGVADTELKFVVAHGRVIASADILTLKSALRVLKDKSLADGEGFQKALAGSGGQLGAGFVYADWAYFYASFFQLGVSALELVPGKENLPKAGIDLNLLPSTKAVTQHLFPSLASARVAGQTVVVTSRGPLPSAEVLAPPLASLAGVLATFADKLGLEEKKP